MLYHTKIPGFSRFVFSLIQRVTLVLGLVGNLGKRFDVVNFLFVASTARLIVSAVALVTYLRIPPRNEYQVSFENG